MKKLLYINNFEAPYRIPFFNLLGEHYDMTLALSQRPGDRKERNAAWFQETERKYKIVYLKTTNTLGKKVGFGIRKMLKDFDLVFMDMYANPTNMFAIWCLNRIKKPFIMSVDGMLPRPNESKLRYFVKKYLLNSPIAILSPGDSVDQCIMHYGVPKEKIQRYHFTSLTADDIARASFASEKAKLEIRRKLDIKEEKVVITVGRFSYKNGYGKGYDVLLQASEMLGKQVGIYIIGDEPTEEFIAWKKAKGLTQVHYIGFKNKNELSEYYLAADLFVLPTREDTWGLVVNEAMTYGLPVITTNRCVAGLELVRDGTNGFLVSVNDADMLADRISRIVGEPELQKSMGKASLALIGEWTAENMAADHISCFVDKMGFEMDNTSLGEAPSRR